MLLRKDIDLDPAIGGSTGAQSSAIPLETLSEPCSRQQEEARKCQVAPGTEPLPEPADSQSTQTPLPVLKLISSVFSFFVAGANDGCLGSLIPYMLESYNIGSSLIAVL